MVDYKAVLNDLLDCIEDILVTHNTINLKPLLDQHKHYTDIILDQYYNNIQKQLTIKLQSYNLNAEEIMLFFEQYPVTLILGAANERTSVR
jgi:hypothetical protein